MTPLSFDAETAREVTGDTRSRTIETKARADADAGTFNPPQQPATSYWGQVQAHMATVVYAEQHQKRIERNKRKNIQSQ